MSFCCLQKSSLYTWTWIQEKTSVKLIMKQNITFKPQVQGRRAVLHVFSHNRLFSHIYISCVMKLKLKNVREKMQNATETASSQRNNQIIITTLPFSLIMRTTKISHFIEINSFSHMQESLIWVSQNHGRNTKTSATQQR